MLRSAVERVLGLGLLPASTVSGRLRDDAGWNTSVDSAAHAAVLARECEAVAPGSGAPPLFRGTFHQAQAEATARGALLLVFFVPSELHPERTAFVRDVMCAREVREALGNGRVVAWAADATMPFARALAARLRVERLPATLFLAPAARRPGQWLVLTCVEGVPAASSVRDRALGMLAALVAASASREEERAERDGAQRLREEQDAAYERSLAADAQRRLEREQAAAAERAAAEAEALRVSAIEREKQEVGARRAAALSEARSVLETHRGVDGGLRLSLLLPDGRRVQRALSAETPCSFVYIWAFASLCEGLGDAPARGVLAESEESGASGDQAGAKTVAEWLEVPEQLVVRVPLGGDIPHDDTPLAAAGITGATKLIAERRSQPSS